MLRDREHDELALALTRMGLIAPGDVFAVTRLSGGVSCDVWKLEPEGAPALVIKRFSPFGRLRVRTFFAPHAEPAEA